MTERKAELLVTGSVLFATAGQVVLKLGAGRGASAWTAPLLPQSHVTVGIVCGLLIYSLGTLLWVAAVSRKNISYLYPLGSLSYIFVMLCSHFVLGESLRLGRCVGVLIMACGIILLMSNIPSSNTEPSR